MALRTGGMRHNITIEQRVQKQDRLGGLSQEWAPVAVDVAASIEPLKGKELFSAEQAQSEVTTRIRIRYRAGITPDMRVVYRKQVFPIQYIINPDFKNEYLQLMCAPGRNEG